MTALSIRSVLQGFKLGGALATSRAIALVSRERGREYLARSLASLPGLPAKAGQIFGGIASSSKDSPPSRQNLSPSLVQRLIRERAPALSQALKSLDPIGKSASLGQVHRAVLTDGRVVAIKVLYPEIATSVMGQLSILMAGFRKFSGSRKVGFEVDAYDSFFAEQLRGETDYGVELLQQQRFSDRARGIPGLCIPQVLPEFSSGSVLVQTYEESLGLVSLSALSPEASARCARRLMSVLTEALFVRGVLHADLHHKNWGYRPDTDTVVFYDFGATLELSDELRMGLVHLRQIASQSTASPNTCLRALTDLGFDPIKLMPVADKLHEVIQIFCAPVVRKDWQAAAWNPGSDLERILGPDRWYLRVAGPPWFLVLMKSISLVHRALVELGGLGVEATPPTVENPGRKTLRVSVKKRGEALLDLELPVAALESIEDFVGEETRQKILDAGYDLTLIKSNALARGFPPGVLFELKTGDRAYRVWIDAATA